MHFLPPYSPQFNPIERVWLDLHANVTRNHRCTTIEAVIELFYAPGTQLDRVRESLRPHHEVVEAWSITGDADCMVRVRVRDPHDLERVIMELQRQAPVVRTRSQFVMSHLIERRD